MQYRLANTNPNNNQGNAHDVEETEGLQITLNDATSRDNLNLNEYGYPNEENKYRLQNDDLKKNAQNGHGSISSDKITPHILLNSMSIMHEVALDDNEPKSLKVECKLWTNGLDRFFKVAIQNFTDYIISCFQVK